MYSATATIHDNKQNIKKVSLATYPLKMTEQTTGSSVPLCGIKSIEINR